MTTPKPSIRIFRSGTHTDIHGQTLSFSNDQLAQIVASYDADSDPAPLVVGHPKTDDPAWGWVGALRLDGETIVAEPADLVPEFAEAVRSKRYRKVSASFYPPRHPANPKPGAFYLKHVGFLGAAAPSVKGLGTVSFSEADDDSAFTLSFSEEHAVTDTPTLEEREAALALRESQLDTRETTIAGREVSFAEAETSRQHDANVAFAEGLISAGTLAPAGKDKVVGLMDLLDASAVASFGEGDAGQMTPLAAFRSLFDTAHPVVAFGEAAPADRDAGPTLTLSFSAPTGYRVEEGQAELHARATEIQGANPGMTFWQAFTQARATAGA